MIQYSLSLLMKTASIFSAKKGQTQSIRKDVKVNDWVTTDVSGARRSSNKSCV